MTRVILSLILILIFGFAFLTGMGLGVMDKYLDLRVTSYTIDSSRHAINLMHLLLTNSPLLKQSPNEIQKLVLSNVRIDEYNSGWFTDQENIGGKRMSLSACCEVFEYDYNFSTSVRAKSGGNWKWSKTAEFGNLVFDMESMCYMDYQRMKGYAEMPIVVWSKGNDGNYYTPAIANLTLMKTPLSELVFWISQSSLRLNEKYDQSLIKEIRFGPEVEKIRIYETPPVGIVCMFKRNSLHDKICKQFYYSSAVGMNISDSSGSWGMSTFTQTNPFEKVFSNNCNNMTVDADINRIPQIMLKFS
jgi:hypothetical protein